MKNIALISCLVTPIILLGQIEFRSILINDPGPDDFHFFELIGSPFQSLSNTWYIEIDGDGGNVGRVNKAIDLSVYSLGQNGLLLYRENEVMLPIPSLESTVITNSLFSIQNGDATFLLVEGFSGNEGDDLDTNNDGILETNPWVDIIDGVGVDQDNSDPDIAATLGFEVINDNGGSMGTWQAWYIFSKCSNCADATWYGARMEEGGSPNTHQINQGSWYSNNQSGIDCEEDSNKTIHAGNSSSPFKSIIPDLSNVQTEFCIGDFENAYILPTTSADGYVGTWVNESNDLVTFIDTTIDSSFQLSFIITSSVCSEAFKTSFQVFPPTNTTLITF